MLSSIYRTAVHKSWERYYYDSTVMAPSSYPIHVRDCTFLTGDDNDDGYVRYQNVNKHTSEWGDSGDFLQLSDKSLLPKKLAISYFSYRDKHFYKDTLALPTAKIEELFKQAIKNNNTERYYSSAGNLKGLCFTIGIANDGQVLVFLRGINLEELVLKAKLKPSQPAAEDLYYRESLSREHYFNYAFENLSDSLKLKIDSGFEMHANYADSATHYLERNVELWKYQK